MFHKLLICLCFACSLSYSASAQDIVVSAEGDTLNCKIKKITSKGIYLDYVRNGKTYSTMFAHSYVKFYEKGTGEVISPQKPTQAAQSKFLGYWQDTIITVKDDTILCRITRISAKEVHFKHAPDGKTRSAIFPKTYLKSYKKGAKQSTNQTGYGIQSQGGVTGGVFVGLGHHLASVGSNVSSGLKEHLRKLKTGLNLGLDLNYMANMTSGIGFNFRLFYRTLKSDVSDPNLNFSNINSNLTVLFVGPAYVRQRLAEGGRVVLTVGLGYASFTHKLTISDSFSSTNKITAGNIGALFGVARDINLPTTNIKLRLQASLFFATFSELKVSSGSSTTTTQLTGDERENFTRLNLSIGFAF